MRRQATWDDEGDLVIGDLRFPLLDEATGEARGTADALVLYKPRWLVESYLELAPAALGGNVVELGIFRGGSTVFLAELLEPAAMVAVDLAAVPPALDTMLHTRGWSDRVRTAGGIDQGDPAVLGAVVDEVFGEDQLDLVIDDASHLLEPTRVSFELLFPRLRPGSWFVLEDWSWQLDYERRMTVPPPWVRNASGAVPEGATDARAATALLEQAIGQDRGVLVELATQYPQEAAQALRSQPELQARLRARYPDEIDAVLRGDLATLGGPAAPMTRFARCEDLTPLVVELTLVSALYPEVVEQVDVRRGLARVRRGPGDIGRGPLVLDDLVPAGFRSALGRA